MAIICSWQRTTLALSCAVAYLSSSVTVNAHGYVSSPKAQFKDATTYTDNDYLLEAKDAGVPLWVGKKWNSTPEKNTQLFTELFKNQTTYKTLKDLCDAFVKDCGNTRLDVPSVDVSVGYKELKYQNDEKQMGIVDTHHGPCEIWIDKTRVFQANDCRAYSTAYPAVFPVDYSVCKGECVLTYYLMAVHEPQWQIYKQCVPVKNPLGVGPPADTVGSDATSAPVASTSSASGSTSGSATKPSSVVGGDASATTVPAPTPAPTSSAATTTSAVSLAICAVAAVAAVLSA